MPEITASTTPAASRVGSSEFYRWQVPNQPLAIEIQLDLVDRLDREVVQTFRAITSRGSEIGGLLLGSYREQPEPTLVITDYEAVPCDYNRGPLYMLTEEDRRRLEEALLRHRRSPDPRRTVVGYFRSNTRKELVLDDEDVAILKRYFAGPPSVCLLIKPFASKANLAGFFLWVGDEPQRTSPLTFPFNKSELLKVPSPGTAAGEPLRDSPSPPASPAAEPVRTIQLRIPLTETGPTRKAEDGTPTSHDTAATTPAVVSPVEADAERLPAASLDGKPAAAPPPLDGKAVFVPAPEEAAVSSPPGESAPPADLPTGLFATVESTSGAPARSKRSRIALGLGAVLALAIGGAVVWNLSRSSPPAVAPDSSSLNLRVERSGGQLLLSWNRSLPLLQTAQRAILSISDGDHREDVEMDLGQLRSGSIVYSPITSDVSFRLEVTDLKNGKSVSESVRVLGGRPSPSGPPAEASPARSPETTEVAESTKPVRQPSREMAPIPTPTRESLAARLSPVEPIAPAGSALEAPTATMPVATASASGPPTSPAPAPATAIPPAPQPAAEAGQRPPETRAAQPAETAAPTPAVTETRPSADAPKPAPTGVAAAPPAETPLRVGGQVQEARLIRRREPVYPPLARQARIQGVVKLEAVIGPDGRVEKVEAISGPPLLRQAAIDAVRQWVYEPSRLNGQPVRVTTQIEINFTLGR